MKKIICVVLIVAMFAFATTGCSSAITNAVKSAVASSIASDKASDSSGNSDTSKESPAASMTATTGQKVGDSFKNYLTAKSSLVSNMTSAMGDDQSMALLGMGLLGVSLMDVSLIPLTLVGLGEDPQTAAAALGFLGAEGVKYSANGNEYKIEYKDSNGKSTAYDSKYDAGTGSLTSTMTQDGQFYMLTEYTTVKDGYAGQIYYKNDDGTFETVKILTDANGTKGIIGMLHKQSSQPATIFGKGDGVGADFGKDCTDWYVLANGKVSASVDGQSYNQ
ncbi:MAG: hypothetical protein WCP73_04050 [Eubacteriales bacterium]